MPKLSNVALDTIDTLILQYQRKVVQVGYVDPLIWLKTEDNDTFMSLSKAAKKKFLTDAIAANKSIEAQKTAITAQAVFLNLQDKVQFDQIEIDLLGKMKSSVMIEVARRVTNTPEYLSSTELQTYWSMIRTEMGLPSTIRNAKDSDEPTNTEMLNKTIGVIGDLISKVPSVEQNRSNQAIEGQIVN